MTCEDVLARLDDYVDGECPAAELHEIELHLASCASCREEERALRSLLREAAALPKVAHPERDLWPEIAAEIKTRPRLLAFPSRPAIGIGLAAAAALLLAFVMLRDDSGPGSGPVVPSAQPTFVAASPEATLREAEGDYERATQALLATLEEHRDQLAPETLKSVGANLAVIDEALKEVRAALEKDPGNPELTRMLAATHRKKVDVLQRVVKLSTSRL
jgi:anti-sigma factor RsiW